MPAAAEVQEFEELTEEETYKLLDEQARRYLNMSAEEFIRRADDGTLPHHPVVAHLVLFLGGPVNFDC